MVEVVTLIDARFEAERAKKNVALADELARLRRRSWELAIMRSAPDDEIRLAHGGMVLAETERDFWSMQALRFAALAAGQS